jgi:hypothetical protein
VKEERMGKEGFLWFKLSGNEIQKLNSLESSTLAPKPAPKT